MTPQGCGPKRHAPAAWSEPVPAPDPRLSSPRRSRPMCPGLDSRQLRTVVRGVHLVRFSRNLGSQMGASSVRLLPQPDRATRQAETRRLVGCAESQVSFDRIRARGRGRSFPPAVPTGSQEVGEMKIPESLMPVQRAGASEPSPPPRCSHACFSPPRPTRAIRSGSRSSAPIPRRWAAGSTTCRASRAHCGVCHYDFNGAGPRNPYGARLGSVIGRTTPTTTPAASRPCTSSRTRTPTATASRSSPRSPNLDPVRQHADLPRPHAVNVGQHQRRAAKRVTALPGAHAGRRHPAAGRDRDLAQRRGDLAPARQHTVTWTATDNVGVTASTSTTATARPHLEPARPGPANTGTLTWFVHNTPDHGRARQVVARDAAGNSGPDRATATSRS